MQGRKATLEELAAVGASVFPPFDEREQSIVIATYRALTKGRPVSTEQIAQSIGLGSDEVKDGLVGWNSRVHFDAGGCIVAFFGLDLSPTTHRFAVGGRGLYTWCAWDTLFIPRVLEKTAEVQSECPVTGQPIRLISAPNGVRHLEPAETVVSFVTPERAQVEKDIIASFCCHVHFLSSADAARAWLVAHPDTAILSVEEAWRLGQMCVDARLQIA